MAEYIERDKVLEMSHCTEALTYDNPLIDAKSVVDVQDIEALPVADVEEVRHGEWIEEYRGLCPREKVIICSLCGRMEERKEPYCHCGAKMDGKDINVLTKDGGRMTCKGNCLHCTDKKCKKVINGERK